MVLVFTFILSAGLNFATGLLLAALLGPDTYGLYAVAATSAAVLATALFDWLRLSTTRFYGAASLSDRGSIRATLDAAYGTVAICLVGGAAVFAVVSPAVGLSRAFVAAVVLGSIANAAFDYATALARARFLNRAYAILVAGKGVLVTGCAAAVAWGLGNAQGVLAAQALATGLALLPTRALLGGHRSIRPSSEPGSIGRFARYGLPIVAANALLQGVTLLNRSATASMFGFAAAGQLALATDVSLRLFLAAGAALDVFLFQVAVRTEAEQGRVAAEHCLRRNMLIVAAVLVLLAVGFACTMPAFTALLVPVRFRAEFPALALTLLPGVVLMCFGQFALNPVFQLAHRTGPLIIGALVTLAVDCVGLLAVHDRAGVVGVAGVHALSLGIGCIVLAIPAFARPTVRPALSDIGGIALAALAVVLVLWPVHTALPPTAVLACAAVLGPAAFGLVLFALDVGGIRPFMLARALRFMRPGAVRRPA